MEYFRVWRVYLFALQHRAESKWSITINEEDRQRMNDQRLEKDVQHLRDTELRCTGWKQEERK